MRQADQYLFDELWQAQIPTVAPARRENTIGSNLESAPANATRWSPSKRAQRAPLSPGMTRRMWDTLALGPHGAGRVRLSHTRPVTGMFSVGEARDA